MGAYVIDYDRIARDIVQPGRPAWQDIKDHFGAEVIRADGTIDRSRLAAIVFNNTAQRIKLESFTHPRILDAANAIEKAISKSASVRVIVHDIPLLFEVHAEKLVDLIIVAYTSHENQMERLIERDGSSEEEARARIAAQMPLEEKTRLADYVIDNNGTLEDTRKQVKELYLHLLERERNYGPRQLK